MAQSKLTFTVAVVVGAFLLYCGGEAAKQGDGGVVSQADAHAGDGECCAAALPTRTRLLAGTLASVDQSETISVEGYTSIILQRDPAAECSSYIHVGFKDQESDQTVVTVALDDRGGQIPVMGNYVQLRTDDCAESLPFVLVGVN